MIRPEELRIGNHVILKGREYQVDAFDIYKMAENDENDEVQPIPLTEEWLLKFGFDSDGDEFWEKGGVQVGYHYGEENGFIHIRQQIEYVHQLQNLYFALTRKELEIKEA